MYFEADIHLLDGVLRFLHYVLTCNPRTQVMRRHPQAPVIASDSVSVDKNAPKQREDK